MKIKTEDEATTRRNSRAHEAALVANKVRFDTPAGKVSGDE
jgi:hypothetical protein